MKKRMTDSSCYNHSRNRRQYWGKLSLVTKWLLQNHLNQGLMGSYTKACFYCSGIAKEPETHLNVCESPGSTHLGCIFAQGCEPQHITMSMLWRELPSRSCSVLPLLQVKWTGDNPQWGLYREAGGGTQGRWRRTMKEQEGEDGEWNL